MTNRVMQPEPLTTKSDTVAAHEKGRNTYRRRFVARCPIDGAMVVYSLAIATEEVLKVEDIIHATNNLTQGMHEDIAGTLARIFGGRQTLVATHSDVEIETHR